MHIRLEKGWGELGLNHYRPWEQPDADARALQALVPISEREPAIRLGCVFDGDAIRHITEITFLKYGNTHATLNFSPSDWLPECRLSRIKTPIASQVISIHDSPMTESKLVSEKRNLKAIRRESFLKS